MKRIETIAIKIIICQIVFLIIAQWILMDPGLKMYMNRVYQYEGIHKGTRGETVETIDHSGDLWYDKRAENEERTD